MWTTQYSLLVASWPTNFTEKAPERGPGVQAGSGKWLIVTDGFKRPKG